jgi:DNA-directed RNA polymerase specialized sigma24 family protein
MLRAWLASRFPHLTEIDDIIQDAYTHVLAARASGTALQSPKAFLFATAPSTSSAPPPPIARKL